jgi:hypothetical protein
MNEQLHKLCKQALEQARVNACAKNKTDRPQNNTVWNEFPEVFAELIIKDCLELADLFEIDVNQSGLVSSIKNHFGIE